MKKLRIVILLAMVCLAAFPGTAQKQLPYTFQFEQGADSLKEQELKVLTQVSYANAASLRLYFKGTQLGENSYLLLEGTHGAKQELRRQDLENWNFSSAYFNGNAVKVSLMAAAGEKNRVHISEIKVGNAGAAQSSTARISSEALQTSAQAASSTSASLQENYPHTKAVGRFTNGNQALGNGWIAPNGAIVTSYHLYENVISKGYDVIEFNVPPSAGIGQVNHPGPEDQYPLDLTSMKYYHEEIYVRKFYWSVWSPHMFKYYPGYAIIKVLPNNTGKTPGQRQGEYFQILENPSSSLIGNNEILLDLFMYGEEVYFGQYYKTLQSHPSRLLMASDYIKSDIGVPFVPHRDNFIIHNLTSNENNLSSWGAPITYDGTNVAIGIHVHNVSHTPAIGYGFRDDKLMNELTYFLSPKSVFVDSNCLQGTPNGKVNRPYRSVQPAVSNAPDGAQLYIARGEYDGAVTIDRPMTLRAPVGKVIIGTSGANARTAASASIPRELYMDDAPGSFNDSAEEEELDIPATLVSYPNPFTDRTEVNYSLPEETQVTVKIYDSIGNQIRTLLQTSQLKGNHSVVWDGQDSWGNPASTGIYIIKLQAGTQIQSIRVIKK